MKNIEIKSVNSESAGIILNIHYDAVHGGKASSFYSQKILNAWSPPITKDRIKKFSKKITETQPVVLLACLDSQPAGFGILDLKQERIGAIYVKATFAGFHIGVDLLQEIEQIAFRNGYKQLHLESSLNAKTFYEKYGYTNISEGFFALPSGIQMKSVIMTKMLTSI